jgi:two-component system LytT family sensor kinase
VNKILLVLFATLLFKLAVSQNEKDSLIQLLKNHPQHDTLRCFHLIYLIDYENDPEVWNKYNNELEKISLEGISKNKKNSTDYITFLSCLSRAYNNKSSYCLIKNDLESSFKYIQKAYQICLSLNDDGGAGLACHNIALKYENIGKIDTAIVYYKKAINHYTKKKDNEQAAMVISDMGDTYRMLGDMKTAIELNLQALDIFEKSNNRIGIERTCFAIGKIFYEQKEYKKALNYFNKALKINIEEENQEKTAKVYISIAQTYLDDENFEKAYEKIKKALDLDLKNNQERSLIADYRTLGTYYTKRSKIDSAIICLNKSLLYSEKSGILAGTAMIHVDLASSYKTINDKLNQRKSAETALRIAQKVDHPKIIYQAAEILAEIYKEKKEYSNYANMLEIVLTYKNKLYNDETKNIAIKKEFEFTDQKKEAAIKELEQQNQITSLQSKQKSIILYSIISLVVAIALLTYFLFTRYKTKKQNELLKTKLEDAELLLIEKQKASDSEIKAIKSQMNPHFFYNALNSIQGYIYSGDKENAAKSLGLFSDLSRSVLESSRNTEISLHDEVELIRNYLKLETMRLPKIKYNIQTSENINLHDVYIPAMILQPLVENAIKHGLANKQGEGILTVNFAKTNEDLIITIEDDGIGRDAAAEIGKRMMKKSASFSTNANMSRIELLNANKTNKITQEIIDKKDSNGVAIGTIVKIVIPIEVYD